jgi:hypothetical protein
VTRIQSLLRAEPLMQVRTRRIPSSDADAQYYEVEAEGRAVTVRVPMTVILESNGIEQKMRLWAICAEALKEQ